MIVHGLTDAGKVRSHNEDAYLIQEFSEENVIFGVSDGMGGEVGGEIASSMAVEGLKQLLPQTDDPGQDLKSTLEKVHGDIREEAKSKGRRVQMGATATFSWIIGDVAHWAHTGDSRLYLFRSDVLNQITRDHTTVGLLLEQGQITPEQAKTHPMRNALLNHLGGRSCKIQTGHFALEKDDILIVCSDGLHGEVEEKEIVGILTDGGEVKEKLEH